MNLNYPQSSPQLQPLQLILVIVARSFKLRQLLEHLFLSYSVLQEKLKREIALKLSYQLQG
jgi:hypothetical protein